MQNPSTYHFERKKACKIDEYLYVKNCSCKKRLFCKLLIAGEDEIFIATEQSLAGKMQNPLSERIPIIILI